MSEFTEFNPSLENYWRAIILFGRNVASYKFALGKSLLELTAQEKSFVTLEELAVPFSKHICNHLRLAAKQVTSSSSRFLDACRKFNAGETSEGELIATTTKLGFNNVIDAFHVVHDGEIGVRFFVDDRRGKNGITLTDDLLRLRDMYQYGNLTQEVEARWRLVETAWELNLPRQVLTIDYDSEGDLLIPNRHLYDRRPITGCRDALNGYQKGRCFYCCRHISIVSPSPDLAEVDHLFPHLLKPHRVADPIDGVWNLVLACQECNRGENGKFARLPELRYLERLHRRNEFFIGSHHPLRDTLILQTGITEQERRFFLQTAYNEAKRLLVQTWKSGDELAPAF
jgi:5-methylcytosine-specific restriction endonuclease McrA